MKITEGQIQIKDSKIGCITWKFLENIKCKFFSMSLILYFYMQINSFEVNQLCAWTIWRNEKIANYGGADSSIQISWLHYLEVIEKMITGNPYCFSKHTKRHPFYEGEVVSGPREPAAPQHRNTFVIGNKKHTFVLHWICGNGKKVLM